MERAFPSRFEPEFLSTSETITLCLAALFGFGSLLGLCLTFYMRPSSKLVSFWFAALISSPFGVWIAHEPFENNWRHATGAAPWLMASFWTVLIMSAVGAITADIRLANSGRKPVLLRMLRYSFYVVVISGVFLALVPAHPQNWPAPRPQCKSNLKQIGIALRNYHDVMGMFPSAQISTPPISWRPQTLPYIDHALLWEDYIPEKTWDSTANEPVAQTQIPTYQCPSRKLHGRDKDNRDRYYTDYTMLVGSEAFSGHNKSTRFRDITDGTSNTLAVVEATGLNIVWTAVASRR